MDLIDLDFERTWDHSAAVSRYFLDSKIDVEGDLLGLLLRIVIKINCGLRFFLMVKD